MRACSPAHEYRHPSRDSGSLSFHLSKYKNREKFGFYITFAPSKTIIQPLLRASSTDYKDREIPGVGGAILKRDVILTEKV